MTILAALVLAIWLGLVATGFWTCREADDNAPFAAPGVWPEVVAVVPARNEADVITRSIGSLLRQDYAGPFRVVLVDDNSEDGTGDLARTLGDDRLNVLRGAPLATGWTGKLWAVHQGIIEAGAPRYLWLTDADIEHAPDTLTRLVGIAQGGDRRLVSFMALLSCRTWAEKWLVPAFIWFFMMLYPFNWINRPKAPISGAAGGCVLVEREALEAAGGIGAMRGALIDDCTLGALIKKQGPIWLGLTRRSVSIRPYSNWREIGMMIARSAYAQLRYNPLMLVGTVLGLGLMFGAPVWLALTGHGAVQVMGLIALGLMLGSYQPILGFYGRAPMRALALPLVALFYVSCTIYSAWAYYRGKGGMWKGRAQALDLSGDISGA
ncbi:glycosyltransferase [Novosphingobium sp. SG707]|uniref:glycosyltransferase n=1 Tax=Novosphingobium sp. SG707 TaxID=2586996 RepID=UPI0014471C34|nr:glycosyltransferase [Novosphingobium sp. SG707]NKJ02531.1 hopene-associated glycosyltransferase HpnB [Novosphingobium sp. SG707]